jgi:hypothetical protein
MLTVLQSLVPSFVFYRTLTVNLRDKYQDIFKAVRITSTFHSVSTVCCAGLYLSGLLSDDFFVSIIRLLMSGFFTYDIIHVLDNYKYYGKTPSQVFIAHHLVALYGLSYLPVYLPYVAPTLLTEITTPFVNLSWYSNKRYGNVKPAWYFANALCVLAGFLVFRVANVGNLMLTGIRMGEYRLALFQSALLSMNIGWTVKLFKLYNVDWKKSKLL